MEEYDTKVEYMDEDYLEDKSYIPPNQQTEDSKKSLQILPLKKRTKKKRKKEIRLPVECPICQISIKGKDVLKQHILRVHEKIKPHLCNLCGRSFGCKTNLRKHIEAVHDRKEYFCEYCTEAFKTEYLYKHHKAEVHEGKGPVKCPLCEAELKSKQTLRYGNS